MTVQRLPYTRVRKIFGFLLILSTCFLLISYILLHGSQPTSITGSISVSSTPSGASIYLDGNFQGTTPLNIVNVEAGNYIITLELKNAEKFSQVISVDAAKTTYIAASLSLMPSPTEPIPLKTGSISIISSPSGATIYLDGAYQGTTPLTIDGVEAGSYNITLKLKDFEQFSTTFFINADETTHFAISLTPVPMPTGSIAVSSIPSGATIYLNGAYKGTTPLKIDGVEAGSYNITLKLKDFEQFSQVFFINADRTILIDVSLTPVPMPSPTELIPPKTSTSLKLKDFDDSSQTFFVDADETTRFAISLTPVPMPSPTELILPTTGNISINSTPSGASIYLNRIPLDNVTPWTIKNIDTGQYTITLKLKDYVDINKTYYLSKEEMVFEAFFTPIPTSSPTEPTPPYNNVINNNVIILSLITAIVSFFGFMSTSIIAWKREKRESKSDELENQRKQIEIEKMRIELDKMKPIKELHKKEK